MSDTITRRYFYKLLANGVGFLAAGLTVAVVPRAIGPEAYGAYSFLTFFFLSVMNLPASGTATCYYNSLSQRPQETGLISFYGGFLVVCSAVLVIGTAAILWLDSGDLVWPDQSSRFVWMGLGWALLTWYGRVLQKTVDAFGLTVLGERIQVQQRCVGVVLILGMVWSGWLDLSLYFSYQYALLVFVIVSWYRVLHVHQAGFRERQRLSWREIRAYGREFWSYSVPLVIVELFALAGGLIDRWLLQRVGGAIEQGFYGFSFQIVSVSVLLTAALTPLLMREFAVAYAKGDIDGLRKLFLRFVPPMYVVAAFLGCYLAVEAAAVCEIVGGDEFAEAQIALFLLAFFPIHSTYGQLSGSVLLATGRTRLYRNISIATTVCGMVLSIWLIGPETKGGLALGSFGLAIKMLGVQLIAVNLQLWFNSKLLGLRFWNLCTHQFITIGVLYSLATLASGVANSVLAGGYEALLLGGALYVVVCICLVFAWPGLVSRSRKELTSIVGRVTGRGW